MPSETSLLKRRQQQPRWSELSAANLSLAGESLNPTWTAANPGFATSTEALGWQGYLHVFPDAASRDAACSAPRTGHVRLEPVCDARPDADALAVGPKLGQKGFAILADALIVPVINRVCSQRGFGDVCIAGVRYELSVDQGTGTIAVALDVTNSGERGRDCLLTVDWLYDKMKTEMIAQGHKVNV